MLASLHVSVSVFESEEAAPQQVISEASNHFKTQIVDQGESVTERPHNQAACTDPRSELLCPQGVFLYFRECTSKIQVILLTTRCERQLRLNQAVLSLIDSVGCSSRVSRLSRIVEKRLRPEPRLNKHSLQY